MNQYKVLTVTHHQVPVDQLQHFIVPADKQSSDYQERLHTIKQTLHIDELMYLNTCNRVTYFFTTTKPLDRAFTATFFKTVNPHFEACNTVHTIAYEGLDALQHMCEVGASLDSMVVGEYEIIRQLRVAYDESNALQLTGDDIRLAMKMLIPAAKRIYTETGITDKPVSIVSLAAARIRALQLSEHARILLIGAGETNTHMSAYLRDMGFHDFTVYNRTLANGEKLARHIGGTAYPLDKLPEHTGGFDVIVSCTGAVHTPLTCEVYRQMLQGDTTRKVIIDLAIPTDIDPRIPVECAVDYINIDDLRIVAKKNMELRKTEVVKAKQLVHDFVKEFQSVYIERLVEKAHSQIPLKLREIRNKAIDEVYAREVDQLDPQAREVLDKVMDYLEKKYLALTMASSKNAMRGPQA